MYLIVESVYPNLEREMLKKDKTLNVLVRATSNVSVEYLIEKLQDRKPLTVIDAQKIKKAIGSEMPLEKLFEREGD